MSVRCALCGGAMQTRFRVREFEIVRCDRCDLERVARMPTDAELAAVYASGYFSGRGHGYEDYFGRERAIADDKARARMDALERAGIARGARVLEVGCADGRFLLEAQRRGCEVQGVEWAREAREAAEASVREAIGERLDRVEGTFDAFAAFDVIEHWNALEAQLALVRSKLRAGALVAVVVPVIDNGNARWWPRTWDQYKPPEHLWFFSRRSITAVIERFLNAERLFIEPAWTREARVLDAVHHRRGALSRAEASAWRAMVRRGWIAPERLVDSVLLVARVRP